MYLRGEKTATIDFGNIFSNNQVLVSYKSPSSLLLQNAL